MEENYMKELVAELNNAADLYYNGGTVSMSDREFDRKYDELLELERTTGVILPDSPTLRAGYQVVEGLEKFTHPYPALSLDKTKDVNLFADKFRKGAADARGDSMVLMWKLDGSTVVLYYKGGTLQHAVTRGNGEVGSIIDHNAPFIRGIPKKIPFKGELVLRGEAVMSYGEFDRITKANPDADYANPRNLANATISMLDPSEGVKKRGIDFLAFNLVSRKEDGLEILPAKFSERLNLLTEYGFTVVPWELVHVDDIPEAMDDWGSRADSYDYPVDGLVGALNQADYADTLPGTGHNPNILRGYAFKWKDETAETTLRDIEWSPSRTGLLNPVAVFDPVELEGTMVSRASLHNVSYIMDKDLRVEDKVTVYKANKIIPQIADNLSTSEERSRVKSTSFFSIPMKCPVCGETTALTTGDVKVLKCWNPDCAAKRIGSFVHFCERDCMDIRGMSEETITKFVERGFLKRLPDLFHLDRYEREIVSMEGFGRKSYDNLIAAVEKARTVDFISFIHALGIPNVGKGQAKLIKKHLLSVKRDGSTLMELFCMIGREDSPTDLLNVDGIGNVIYSSLVRWIEENYRPGSEFWDLLDEITISDNDEQAADTGNLSLAGKTFVITGDVHIAKNRAELQKKIEELGGKASGSVSSKTTYLINNDVTSTSGKNKKAKELGVPIISEDEFFEMIKK
jgi:DNA ligase (NAD+)